MRLPNHTLRLHAIAASAALLASGCVLGPADEDPGISRQITPIINGSAPDQPMHTSTVGLHRLSFGSTVAASPYCSGTLVGPEVVVTAAHCVDVAPSWSSRFSTADPGSIAVYVGDDPSADLLAHVYRVVEVVIEPGYDRFENLSDIALIRLAVPVTEAVTFVSPLPPSLGVSSGDVNTTTLNFSGFGRTESFSSGVKLQADGVLGGLGCRVAGCPGSGDAATQISYRQSAGRSGPCFGDSGGPAYLFRGGTPYLAGVTSYGDSRCNQYGVSTRVDAFHGWIEGFVGVSPPPVEPPPPPPPVEPPPPPPPPPACLPRGSACSSTAQCCDGRRCRDRRGSRTCR